MRVLVLGSPQFHYGEKVTRLLDALDSRMLITTVIDNGEGAASICAYGWAFSKNIEAITHAALWNKVRPADLDDKDVFDIAENSNGGKYNRAAGSNRDRKLFDEKPDLVISCGINEWNMRLVNRIIEARNDTAQIDWNPLNSAFEWTTLPHKSYVLPPVPRTKTDPRIYEADSLF